MAHRVEVAREIAAPPNDRPIGKYDVTVVITAFEADRRIEWSPSPENGFFSGY
jgi:hypothetical protein